MNRKAKIIRYTSFTIGMVCLSCGVVFLINQATIPAIVCLTIGVIGCVFAFVPYPFLKEDDNNEDLE